MTPPASRHWRLYTRRGCHLCEQAEDGLAAHGLVAGVAGGNVIDVDGDPALEGLYGRRVPVLEVDGSVVFEGRFDAVDLVRAAVRIVTGQASGRADPASRSGPPPS